MIELSLEVYARWDICGGVGLFRGEEVLVGALSGGVANVVLQVFDVDVGVGGVNCVEAAVREV